MIQFQFESAVGPTMDQLAAETIVSKVFSYRKTLICIGHEEVLDVSCAKWFKSYIHVLDCVSRWYHLKMNI